MPSLALSRSSIRADTASQHSRAETPTHQPAPHQNPGVLAPVTADQSERSLWDAPVSAASTPSIPHSTPQPPINNEPSSSYVVGSDDRVHGGEREEERDNLGVPAPIGKYQPSWDPFNATPIAEEEGFQYDEKPRPSKPPPDATKSVPQSEHHYDQAIPKAIALRVTMQYSMMPLRSLLSLKIGFSFQKMRTPRLLQSPPIRMKDLQIGRA